MPSHGTHASYRAGCRCDDCRATSRDAKRRYRAGIRPGRDTAYGDSHGFAGYLKRHCRCDVCRDTWNTYMREYRKRARNDQ